MIKWNHQTVIEPEYYKYLLKMEKTDAGVGCEYVKCNDDYWVRLAREKIPVFLVFLED